MKPVACLALLGGLLACGGHSNNPPDASQDSIDASIDGSVDTPQDGSVDPLACPPMLAATIITDAVPIGVVLADVNGDGKSDVIATLEGVPSALEVMLGNGDGSFQPALRTVLDPLGTSRPLAPAIADVDGDGDQDAVVALLDEGLAQVALGDGQGNFVLAGRFTTPRPSSLALGDLDRDGATDIVTVSAAGAGPTGVSILFGSGTGSFEAPVALDSTATYDSVALRDVNADLVLDVIAVGDELAVFLGNGDGAFQAPLKTAVDRSSNFGRTVVAGDLDGNGIPDLATAGTSADNGDVHVETWLGSGTGTFVRESGFTLPVAFASDVPQPNEFQARFLATVALGRLDADANLDVAVTFLFNGVVVVGTGTGTGGVQSITEYATSGGPTAVAAGDVSGDGRADLIVTGEASRIDVVLATSSGSFVAPRGRSAGERPAMFAVGDLDGDGTFDVAGGPLERDGEPRITHINVVRSTAGLDQYALPNDPEIQNPERDSVVLRDLDGDGDLDLVVAMDTVASGFISVRFNAGNGTFGPRVDYSTDAPTDAVAVGDLDGDQRPELVLTTGDHTTVFANDGAGTFTARPSFTSQGRALLHDFNNDGKLDLASYGSAASASIQLGNGDGSFQAAVDAATGTAIVQLVIADVDGDGKPDLAADTTTQILVLTGNGDGTFTSAGALPPAPSGLLALANLDGLAPVDLVGHRGVLYRAGTSTRVEDWTITAALVTDLTGDGHPDAVGLGPPANSIFVLPNQCP